MGSALPLSLPRTRWALTPPFHPYPPSRSRTGGLSLLHFPSRFHDRALPGIALCGARTFLPLARPLASSGKPTIACSAPTPDNLAHEPAGRKYREHEPAGFAFSDSAATPPAPERAKPSLVTAHTTAIPTAPAQGGQLQSARIRKPRACRLRARHQSPHFIENRRRMALGLSRSGGSRPHEP